jgi:hypothetical protein
MTDTTKTSRRALLATVPTVAALAAGTTVHGLTAGLATPPSADPIFAAIERHRTALALHDSAHAHFRAMRALYPHPADEEQDPDDFFDWPIEQRFAFREAQAARYEGTPSQIASDRWNNQSDELDEATEVLVETSPTTIAGAAAALEYWAEFSVRLGECSDFDFLEMDCGSRLQAGVADALRNIMERGQA